MYICPFITAVYNYINYMNVQYFGKYAYLFVHVLSQMRNQCSNDLFVKKEDVVRSS